jgi:hypothetical protein
MAFSMQGGTARVSLRDWNGRRNRRGDRGVVNKHAKNRQAAQSEERVGMLKRYRDAAHVTEQKQPAKPARVGLLGRLASVFGFGKGAR